MACNFRSNELKVLVIDNYDSFTYNLVHYLQDIGAQVVIWKNDEKKSKSIEKEVQKCKPTHLLLSPGPGRPKDSGICMDIIDLFHTKIPILGVCLGHQCIGEYFGGTITKNKIIMHGKTSNIIHTRKKLFKYIKSPLQVTRYHSLIIERKSLPKDLIETAWVVDKGSKTIMAIEHRTLPLFGVQFHPESFLSMSGHTLLKNFLRSRS